MRVTGWTYFANVFCPDCAERDGMTADGARDVEGNDPAPVMACTEFDTPQSCGGCFRPIEHSLTPHGVEYVREYAREALERPIPDLRRTFAWKWVKTWCLTDEQAEGIRGQDQQDTAIRRVLALD